MRPIFLTRALATADADGIALDQAIPAGDLTLNGALVAGGVAVLDTQRKVLFTPGAGDNITGTNFTIYGTNSQGAAISEVVAGPNAVTATSVLDYKTVTRIASSAALGAGLTVSVGTSGIGASQPIVLDQYISPFNVSIWVNVTGTVDYTVQYTFDDVFASQGPFTWTNHSDLTAQTTDQIATLISPAAALRIVTNSGTGSAEMIIRQAGAT